MPCISNDPKDAINYVDAYGSVRFTNWMFIDEKMKTDTMPCLDTSWTKLAGSNAQSVLGQPEIAQDLKNYILECILFQSCIYYIYQQQHKCLPSLLPFGQVHCGCCRWSYPNSSARVTLASPTYDFESYFITSDSSIPPIVPPHVVGLMDWQDWQDSLCARSSSVFAIQPGFSSIWCGVWTTVPPLMHTLPYVQGYTPLGHINYVECEQFPGAI
jgi:hypothetical protein